MHSIRIKITAITLAAILISILSVAVAGYFTLEPENDRRTAELMDLLSKNAQLTLDGYLESVEQSTEAVANIATEKLDSVALVEAAAAGSAAAPRRSRAQTVRLDRYLAEYCAGIRDAFGSVANHTHGVVTYYYSISPQVSRAERGFFYSRAGRTGFETLEPLDVSVRSPESEWYYTAVSRGRPSWVGPYQDARLDNQWIVSYLMPIYKAGSLIGVLGMDILLDTLVAQLRPIRVYETGFACLFDAEGRVIYHPMLEIGSRPEAEEFRAGGEIFSRKDSQGMTIRYTAGGEERQLAFSTLSSGMKLAVSAPAREIGASWNRLTRIVFLSAAAIIAVFALFSMLILGLITRPLQELTAASERLAAGDYDVALPHAGPDEVGTLAGAFSQMRGSLKTYILDLNRRVEHDELTGLLNMSAFFSRAEELRAGVAAQGRQTVTVFFDLVGMKHYNRQYGFDGGDALICEVADILARHYGVNRCCRLAQDHFAAITGEDGLEEELRAVFRDCRSIGGGQTLPVRAGVYPDRLEAVSASVACDRAKYAADRHRGSYISAFYYFDDATLRQVEDQRYIINNLDRALDERWIKVYFQPIVRAANSRICDEEALSRWMDPERGPIPPDKFIPILENARLIYKLDLYVLDQILLKMEGQKLEGLPVVSQSLNLSRMDFDACDIVEEVRKRVDGSGVPRDKLTIEITESCVGSDFNFMKRQVERFQALGFQVWMDDFGSGYSSLDVLQDIHFDLIKFDMRFMQRFGDGEESRIILTELMKMAIGLGVETIAEGVETADQVNFLREIGCTKLQGYYFGRAISLAEIVEQTRQGRRVAYENPQEAGYYAAIGRIDLYDPKAVTGGGEGDRFFDALPMAVMELSGEDARVARCNRSFRDFVKNTVGHKNCTGAFHIPSLQTAVGRRFAGAVRQCAVPGQPVFAESELPDGRTARAVFRHVAVDPVDGTASCVVLILSVAAGR